MLKHLKNVVIVATAQVFGNNVQDEVVRIHKHTSMVNISKYIRDSCQGTEVFLHLLVKLWKKYKLCLSVHESS